MSMEHSVDLLPAPKVVRCFFAKQFEPHLPAMELQWDEQAPQLADDSWFFPGQLAIQGPAPTTFGVIIQRCGPDEYRVRLVWNDLGLSWNRLSRRQILTSAMARVLTAIGTDLWQVFEQPIDGAGRSAWAIAGERMTA
jgi:hypothetical protein